MNMQWRKIRGDLCQHRLKIGLIGLVLTLGTAGVAAAWQARVILQREIAASYERANAPDIVLWFDAVDPSLLARIRARVGVAAADARRTALTRVAAKSGAWFPMRVTVMGDLSDQSVSERCIRIAATCPPPAPAYLLSNQVFRCWGSRPAKSCRYVLREVARPPCP